MNRRFSLGSLIGIAAMILIIVALIFSLNNSASTRSENEGVSAASTGYPAPTNEPYPIGTTLGVRVVETNNQPLESTPTIIPNASDVFQGQPVKTIYPSLPIDYISEDYDVFANYLFGEAKIRDGGRALIQIDLQTGGTDILIDDSSPVSDFSDITVAADHIAWTSDNHQSLYSLSRNTGTYETIHDGSAWQPDTNVGLIAWVDSSRNSTIYLYNTTIEQSQAIVEDTEGGRLGYPKICSSEWLVYLHNFAYSTRQLGTTPADMSLYHIPTGNITLIGDVTNAPNIPIDRNVTFDCDESRLVWVKKEANQDNPHPQVYTYSFSERSTSRLSGFTDELSPSSAGVSLENDIVLSRVGYDLRHDAPFTLFVDKHTHWGAIHLSDQRIVWSEYGKNDTAKAIYTINLTEGGR